MAVLHELSSETHVGFLDLRRMFSPVTAPVREHAGNRAALVIITAQVPPVIWTVTIREDQFTIWPLLECLPMHRYVIAASGHAQPSWAAQRPHRSTALPSGYSAYIHNNDEFSSLTFPDCFFACLVILYRPTLWRWWILFPPVGYDCHYFIFLQSHPF